jgi:cytochrome d ubiquinol oxidase subunit II
MIFILAGLTAYTVLAGADFGAGLWTLLAVPGRADAAATRDHARHAMGPVWEANHVWLIFVLVVCWTAYPVAFGSITSTLAVPLFIAAVGIILRGASYALRGQLDEAPGRRTIESVFAVSSILTPFALGTVVGGIASGRVPVGNAAGDLFTSWLNPTSIFIGALAVVTGGHLAAVYLAADAHRLGEPMLARDFRARALISGLCAGALALGGLLVERNDAPSLYDKLTHGVGVAMVAVSAVAGLAALALVWRSRLEPARAAAALAVAAIVAGWALAQRPQFLPGLTIEAAAAGRSTLLAVIVSVAVGAVVLVPSLVLLFRLFLGGSLSPGAPGGAPARILSAARGPAGIRLPAVFAGVTLLAGVGMTVLADSGPILALGVVCLFACAVSTFGLATTGLAPSGPDPASGPGRDAGRDAGS